jgi:hypothetical protein
MGKIKAGVGRVTIIPPVLIYLISIKRYEDSHSLRDDLVHLMAGLVRIAHNQLVPASLDFRRGESNIGVNRRSPFSQTLFAGYNNGKVGYIPLPEEYLRGGYEVDEPYLSARLPGLLAPRASALVE